MPESGERRMIVRARTVVTMDGPPIGNGAVVVSADRIVDVGEFDQIEKENAGEIVDLGEQALLPGLINAHCHLDYTCLRGKIPPPNRSPNGSGRSTRRKQTFRRKIMSARSRKDLLRRNGSEQRQLRI